MDTSSSTDLNAIHSIVVEKPQQTDLPTTHADPEKPR